MNKYTFKFTFGNETGTKVMTEVASCENIAIKQVYDKLMEERLAYWIDTCELMTVEYDWKIYEEKPIVVEVIFVLWYVNDRVKERRFISGDLDLVAEINKHIADIHKTRPACTAVIVGDIISYTQSVEVAKRMQCLYGDIEECKSKGS